MRAADHISLWGSGSSRVRGRCVEISGKPTCEVASPGGVPRKRDPNGCYLVEQMYAQYFLPLNRVGRVPLVLWYGGGLTGACNETTPERRPGWDSNVVGKGWDVYSSDPVERGRAGIAMVPLIWSEQPEFMTSAAPMEHWPIGTGNGCYDHRLSKVQLR